MEGLTFVTIGVSPIPSVVAGFEHGSLDFFTFSLARYFTKCVVRLVIRVWFCAAGETSILKNG